MLRRPPDGSKWVNSSCPELLAIYLHTQEYHRQYTSHIQHTSQYHVSVTQHVWTVQIQYLISASDMPAALIIDLDAVSGLGALEPL